MLVKPVRKEKTIRVAVALVLLGVGLWLLVLDFGTPARPWHSLATVAYAMTFIALLLAGVFELPGLRFHIWRSLSDLIKGIVLFASSLVWVVACVGHVPDSDVGVAIILVPFGALLLSGASFFLRGLWTNPH
jgi:hypothetical protein